MAEPYVIDEEEEDLRSAARRLQEANEPLGFKDDEPEPRKYAIPKYDEPARNEKPQEKKPTTRQRIKEKATEVKESAKAEVREGVQQVKSIPKKFWNLIFEDKEPTEAEIKVQKAVRLGLRLALWGILFTVFRGLKESIPELAPYWLKPFVPLLWVGMAFSGFAITMVIFQLMGLAGEWPKRLAHIFLCVFLMIFGLRLLIFLLTLLDFSQKMILPGIGSIGLGYILFAYLIVLFAVILIPPQSKIIKFLLFIGYITYIIVLFAYPSFFGPGDIVTEMADDMWEWLKSLWKSVSELGELTESLQARLMPGFYMGTVEQYEGEKLGVFLTGISSVSDVFTKTEPIAAYAQVNARTIGDEPIKVQAGCYAGEKASMFERIVGQEAEDVSGQGTIKQGNEITIMPNEQKSIDCIILADTLDEGYHRIHFQLGFNFTTIAAYRTYYMRQKVKREYQRNQIDPFEEAGIEDTRPVAKNTGGPIEISFPGTETPPLEISSEAGPTYWIRFENKWAGELGKFQEMEIILPEGMSITSINGKEVNNGNNDDELNKYVLEATFLENLFGSTEGDIRDLRVFTKVEESKFMGTDLIKGADIDVVAKYQYLIDKSTEVQIVE